MGLLEVLEMKRKIHATIMLDPDQLETLDILSARTGKSKSQLVGEALSTYLKIKQKEV